jgi:hypothetical protein
LPCIAVDLRRCWGGLEPPTLVMSQRRAGISQLTRRGWLPKTL